MPVVPRAHCPRRLAFDRFGVTTSRKSVCVAFPSKVSPGTAACWRRIATVTAAPVANGWPEAASPASTSPVLMPVRI